MFDETLWADPLLDFLIALEEGGIANSGRTCAANGNVTSLHMEGPYLIYAEVLGRNDVSHHTELVLAEEDGIIAGCSCSYGVDCQHAHAMALVILGEARRRGAAWASPLAAVLPRAWHKGNPHVLTMLQPYLNELFGEKGAAGAAKPAAPKEPKQPEEWWLPYLEAQSEMEQQDILQHAVRRYLPPGFGYWVADDLLTLTWHESNPFERLRQVTAALRSSSAEFGHKQFTPDTALEAFLASDQAREMENAYLRRESEEALLTWLREKTPASFANKSEVELVWTIAPPSKQRLLPQLAYRVLLTSKKLYRSPRSNTSLDQLCREVDSGRRFVDPAAERLLRWLLRSRQTEIGYDTVDLQDNTLLPVRNAIEWITLWGAHSILNWEDGTPVVFDSNPARLTIDGRDGRAEWSVAFPGEDGAVLPLSETIICSDRGTASTYWGNQNAAKQVFARHGNRLHLLEAGGMPDAVLAGAILLPEVPVQRLRGTPVGAR
ncbi:MAG: hypothetical protein RBU21_20065, partial [FCB group bacterium]|nr:hypothetical protein [FCB group bacterium]